MNTVRILHVVGKMHRGGIETLLMCIYRKIDRKKVQFDFLVTSKEQGYYDDEIRELGGRLFYVVSRRENPIKARQNMYQLLKTHPEIKAIQLHMSSCSYIDPLVIAKKSGVKYRIAHAHNTQCAGKIRNILHAINRYRLKKYANIFFACSEDAGKWMFSEKCWENVKVIKNGIETRDYIYSKTKRIEMREKLNIGQDELVVGYVGRFEEQKNPMFICKLFEQVQKRVENVKLLLVGDGSMYEQMVEFLKEKGLFQKVIFTGVVENVNDYLQTMDCFILPSFFEGLGIVAIEAQASGLLTILSDHVPKEAAITNLAHFLPIDEGTEVWSEFVVKHVSVKESRDNMQMKIIKSGYDIISTAKELEQIYLNMSAEEKND